jgi:hypothetical protein
MSTKQVEEAVSVVCDLLTYEIILKFKPRRRRKVWVREWIKRRGALVASSALCHELRDQDEHGQLNFYRLNRNQYMWLLDKVRMQIQKRDSNMREVVPAESKLDVTLRFLASGESFTSLQYLFRVPKNSISKFIPEVLDAIYYSLEEYTTIPSSAEQWKAIERDFSEKWNFPGCFGSIDGKCSYSCTDV